MGVGGRRSILLLACWTVIPGFAFHTGANHNTSDSALLQVPLMATCASVDWGRCEPSPSTGSCLDHLKWAISNETKSCDVAVAEVRSKCVQCRVCRTSDCPGLSPLSPTLITSMATTPPSNPPTSSLPSLCWLFPGQPCTPTSTPLMPATPAPSPPAPTTLTPTTPMPTAPAPTPLVPSPTPPPGATCSAATWDSSCSPEPNSGSCMDHLTWAISNEAKSCDSALQEIVSQCPPCRACRAVDCPTPSPTPPPPAGIPSTYYPHFDISADYLDIASRAKGVGANGGSVTDNYYLVVGDQGGCAGGCDDCCGMQKQVAEKMQQYVAGKPDSTLLFVLAVGDNFYWAGASEGRFKDTWKEVYSVEITDVPWFAVMGNHDYGNSDPHTACPSVSPRFVCNASNVGSPACGGKHPYSTEVQGYDSNQLDANKGGVDGNLRKNFNMPDYTYYYTIPELDFELIAIDWNFYDIDGLGGNGASGGASDVFDWCGGYDSLHQSMSSIKEASSTILNKRARAATSKNVAIFSHYPDWAQDNQNLRELFLADHPKDTNETKVFNFYGHTHNQVCDNEVDGECVDYLTGGSGGCCSMGDLPAGFVAISFDKHKKQIMDCFAPDERCTLNSYSRNREMGEPDDLALDVCPFTRDAPYCPNFLGPGMAR